MRHLQLSASIVHRWRSIGKYCRFIGQDDVTVSLIICVQRFVRASASGAFSRFTIWRVARLRRFGGMLINLVHRGVSVVGE